MEYHLNIVGYIHNQENISELHILPEYRDAMAGLAKGKIIWILLWLHRSDEEEKRKILKVHSHGEAGYPLRGIFATRSPVRPNPIGMYRRRIINIEENRIYVRRMDTYDGTPIIDIKPFASSLDSEE